MATTDEKTVALLKQASYENDHDDNATRSVVKNIRAAALMNPSCKWEDLLGCAPSAIYSMGCCFIVSSADEAQNITLDLVPGSSLVYESLRANLVQARDMGSNAFMEADSGMDTIRQQSVMVYEKIGQVAGCIAQPETGRYKLIPCMRAIQRSAATCHESAVAIHSKFAAWEKFMQDLHAACEEKRTKTSKELANTKEQIVMRTRVQQTEKEIVESAKKDVERWKERMENADKLYQQAVEAFPGQYDVFVQEMLRNVFQIGTSALQGYMAMATGGMFAPHLGVPQGGQGGQGGQSEAHQAPNAGATPETNGLGLLAKSHCYAVIGSHMACINIIRSLLTTGPNGTPDWDKILKTQRNQLKASCMMMAPAADEYPDPADNPYDEQYLSLLRVVGEVASWLTGILEQSSNMSWTVPEPTDPQVVATVQKFRTAVEKIQLLHNKVISLGANAGAGVPGISGKPATEGNSSSNDSYLTAAQHNVETTEAGMQSASQHYADSLEAAAKKEARLAQTEALLTQLTSSKLSLEQIKDIIRKSIEIIAELKEQITSLVTFFVRLSQLVDQAASGPVQQFLEEVTNSVTAGKETDVNRVAIGDFDMLAYRQTMVFQHIITIRAYYSIFADIAEMWITLSDENIRPGLKMCTQLSTMADGSSAGALAAKRGELEEWSRKATANVKKMASKSQEEIRDHLEERLEKIKAISRQLPASESRKGLEQGTEQINKEIKDHIDMAVEPKVEPRFEMD